MSERLVEILWTGGFDSTFRMTQLSRCDIDIQPYYMCDNRNSESRELEAIKKISERLMQYEQTKARILPLIKIDMADRIENEEITAAYKRITKKRHLGTQYDWLGRFAEKHPGIEVGVHDQAIELIREYGDIIKVDDEVIGTYCMVDREKTDKDICLLFQNMHIPLIGYTKLKMKEEYLKNGYEDVMRMTWFCYNPIRNKPCGFCTPCRVTMEEGMTEWFGTEAKIRYKLAPKLVKSSLGRRILWYI